MEFTMPQTKEGLRKRVIGFLRQRKRAGKLIYEQRKAQRAMQILIISSSLIIKFNHIQKWNYWRHCREVANQSEQIYQILPSDKGKHASIRHNMLQLIDECKKLSSVSYAEYLQSSRNQENISHRSSHGHTATA